MKPFHRYLLFQIPSWSIASAASYACHAWFGLPALAAFGLVGLVVLSDFVLYPFFRFGYEARPQVGPEALVGCRARVVKPLSPLGSVKLQGHLWRARMLDADEQAAEQEEVEVLAMRGLTLVVRRAPRKLA